MCLFWAAWLFCLYVARPSVTGNNNPAFKKLNDVEKSWAHAEPNAEKARDTLVVCRTLVQRSSDSEYVCIHLEKHACECEAGLMLVHFAQASGATVFLKSFMCHRVLIEAVLSLYV